jgi:hypothetical protein
MWVIDHPKGLVVFDTGNNVAISDGAARTLGPGNCDGLRPSQKRDDVIDRQLQKLGLLDRQGEGGHHLALPPRPHRQHQDVPEGVHVIQKKELYQAWWPEKFQRAAASS